MTGIVEAHLGVGDVARRGIGPRRSSAAAGTGESRPVGVVWPRWRRSPADVGVAEAASDGVNAPRLACFEDGVSDCDKTLCDSNDHQSMRFTPLFHTFCHNFQGRVMA